MPYKVALFITCLTDQFYPSVGIAVTRILEKLGCQVEFPDAQTCCGQPFYNNGYHPQAAALAKRMIEIFEPYDYVVTPSGSCAAMVREHFGHLFHEDAAWKTGSDKLAGKTFEFVEFLTNVLHADFSQYKLSDTESFTYHYTCHLRGLGVKDESVKLLQTMGLKDFRPMDKTDQCCGFGGTFAMKYPKISGAIVEDKIQCIAATKAQTTICNDAGCTMNIAGMCNRHDVKTDVKHIALVLAQAMGIDVESFA